MKQFHKTSYSKNKGSEDIVYRSVTGDYSISQEAFLDSDPALRAERRTLFSSAGRMKITGLRTAGTQKKPDACCRWSISPLCPLRPGRKGYALTARTICAVWKMRKES